MYKITSGQARLAKFCGCDLMKVMEEGGEQIKYPATCVIHWPTGPVTVCLRHAQQLVARGRALGTYIYSEEIAKISNCKNCQKEEN